MSKDNGGAAFPSPGVLMDDGRGGEYQQGAYEGMTLRDYFAGQALVRITAADQDGVMSPQITAMACYRLADAMIAERAK